MLAEGSPFDVELDLDGFVVMLRAVVVFRHASGRVGIRFFDDAALSAALVPLSQALASLQLRGADVDAWLHR